MPILGKTAARFGRGDCFEGVPKGFRWCLCNSTDKIWNSASVSEFALEILVTVLCYRFLYILSHILIGNKV
jgi:hypothetical protein